jgi:ATP phosphoribosyltransferase
MSEPLVLALPSKGRLKEQVEAWLADCGLRVESEGGDRGYRGRLSGVDGVEVRLTSAGDIAEALDSGQAHLGVTGEDLLRERGEDLDERVLLLRPLGFGRADLVVAAPQSWIDVETMADVDAVAHELLARTGRRLRVATKYAVQTRRFFAERGVSDYRLVESVGATEGAPAAGLAELVVDITTTGATLTANHLRVLADGVILKSQAQLAASLTAAWSDGALAAAGRILNLVEARARAVETATLTWPADQDAQAREALADLADPTGWRASGLLVNTRDLVRASSALFEAGVGPVTATRPEYVFSTENSGALRLNARLERRR